MVNEQVELDKCTSLEEGIGYLRYKDEYNPEATLKEFRKSPKPIVVDDLISAMISLVIGVVISRIVNELLEEQRGE